MLAKGDIMTKLLRSDRSILALNLLDHFDGALYGFLAPIIAASFFPNHDTIIQIMLAYSFFATSIVTRPIGAIIFGLMARKYGQVKPLFYSLIGIGICSLLMGLVPNYNNIGYYGAFILLLLRFVKGIFSAGERAIAKLYILEGKNIKKSYKASYLYHASSMLGIVIASLASTFVYLQDIPELWRICYIFGGCISFYAYKLRKDQNNYKIKKQDLEYEKLNFKILWNYRFRILAVIFTTGFSHITYLIPCVIMNSLIPFITNIEIDDMMKVNNILLLFDAALIFILGPIMARYNYFRVKIIMAALLAITLPFLFMHAPGSHILYISFIRF